MVITIPKGFPEVGIPKDVLDGMTVAEVNALHAGLIAEADALIAWNERRPEPRPQLDFYAGVPFPSPEQYQWKVKTR